MSQLSDAIALAAKKNPILGLPITQQSEGLSAQLAAKKKLNAPQIRASVARQEQRGKATSAADAKPVNDFLSHAYNVLETPLSLTGALMLGHERDVQQGKPESLWTGFGGQTMANARRLLSQGKLGELAQRYSTTSLAANKARAQAGDVGAKYFQKHPSQFGALAFGEEFANPGNAVAGRVLGLLGKGAKAGLTAGGKAAARVVSHPATKRTLGVLGEVSTANRFGEVRQAAADEAARHGGNPEAAANHADVVSRKLAAVPQRAKSVSQHITSEVFKGLSKDEQLAVVDKIEGMTPQIKLSPEREALINTRVQAYRHFRAKLDTLTKNSGYAQDSSFWHGPTYFPRAGHTLAPDLGEEGIEEELASRRSRGGVNVRKETLGANKERTYPTRQHAAANTEVNPEWTPAEALEKHITNRVQNAGIEIGMKRLKSLGLVDDARQDFLPTTQIGTLRTFGSPTLRTSRIHPAVASLVEDLTPKGTSHGLASPFSALASVGRFANRAAAKLQVSNPLYHPIVNVGQNTVAQALTGNLNPIEYLKGLASKGRSAIEAGADIPYSEHGEVADSLRPWSDLTKKEKLGRAAQIPGKAVNAVTNRALYKYIQPRMAEGAFRGLKGKLGSDRAALVTRQILGEPENIPSSMEGASQAFMFPHWNLSQIRLWSKLLAEHPQLYMAPHSAVNARNLSRGVSPQQSDWGTLVPPIVLGKDKRGNDVVLPIPGPANKLLGLADIAGNLATGQANGKEIEKTALNMSNPLLNLAGRAYATDIKAPGPANSTRLYDRDAPPTAGGPGLATLKALAQRYSPARGGLANPLGLVGLQPYSRMSDKRGKWEYKVDQMLRNGYDWNGHFYPGIDEVRKKIAAAKYSGQDYFLWGKNQTKVPIAQAEKYADKMYEKLLKLAPEYEGVSP